MEVAQFQPVDMISNLPDNVLDDILMRLTTREAAKTSVLSKHWRYKWVKLPQLIFDERRRHGIAQNTELARIKFLQILRLIFVLHQGPITKLSLINLYLNGCPEIDHLFSFLSMDSVEDFTFNIAGGDYALPLSFYMFSKLKRLNLHSCVIEPPPTFKGFNCLTRLKLSCVTICDDVFERLITSSPLLEQLVLSSNHIDSLNIDAPMLRLFECQSSAMVCFKKCPLLAMVSVVLITPTFKDDYYDNDDYDRADGDGAFVLFFDSLPALEKLCIDFYHIKKLTAGKVQTRLPTDLVHLKILKLSNLCLDSLDELSSVLCLIRSSPNLEKIRISIIGVDIDDASPVLDYLEVQDYSDIYLNRLEEAKVKFITGTVAEMTIIKLLLEKSPNLKRMVVWMWTRKVDDNGLGVSTELNMFRRASPNAEVCFEAQ